MDEQVKKDYEEYEKLGRIWGNFDKEGIRKIKFPRPERKIIEQLMELDDLTSTISDVLDSIGINGAIPAFTSLLLSPVRSWWAAPFPEEHPRTETQRRDMRTRTSYEWRRGMSTILPSRVTSLLPITVGTLRFRHGRSVLHRGYVVGIAGSVCNGAVRDIPAIVVDSRSGHAAGRL